MKYQELADIVSIVNTIPCEEDRDKAIKLLMQNQIPALCPPSVGGDDKKTILLEFTKKEISRIPMRFRKDILIDGRIIHCRKRKSGARTFNYVLRYRRNGFDLCASSNNLEEAKRKFIEIMQAADRGEVLKKKKREENVVPTNFHKFVTYYFETYRKRKVTPTTYLNDCSRYNNHLKPVFGDEKLGDITPAQCQKFLDGYEQKGMQKTQRELYSLLNCIFKMAIAHNIVSRNPMAIVLMTAYESKHGKALTKEEERTLLEGVKGTRYEPIMALSLYTGLRPNELYTAKIEGDFVVARNSKRKGGKIEYKKIPISVMLKPYIEKVKTMKLPIIEYVRREFNRILSDHVFYDLRTTFYTRCEECGVAPPARDHFVGHSSSVLNHTYCDLSDEYLLREGEKLVW